MKNKKNSKGMLTIEAALVMPLVIYIVFIMIFTFLLIYTRVYVALSTNYATSMATAQWYSIGGEFDVSSKKGQSVIGAAIGAKFSTNEKKKKLEEMIESKIQSATPMTIDPLKISVEPKNFIIGQRLDVTVNATYKLPLSGLFRMMGLTKDGTITDTYTKFVNLSNSEDNMRTITYAKKLIERANFDEIKEKLKGALSGVMK